MALSGPKGDFSMTVSTINTTIVIPDDWDLELYSDSGSEKADDVDLFAHLYDKSVAPLPAVTDIQVARSIPGGSTSVIESREGPFLSMRSPERTEEDSREPGTVRVASVTADDIMAADRESRKDLRSPSASRSPRSARPKALSPLLTIPVTQSTNSEPEFKEEVDCAQRTFNTCMGAGGLMVSSAPSTDGTFRVNIRRLQTRCDVDLRINQVAIASTAWKTRGEEDTRQHLNFLDQCRESLEAEETNEERKYAQEVFSLLSALHSGSPETSVLRFSQWLETAATWHVEQILEAKREEVSAMSGRVTKLEADPIDTAYDEAFWWLCAKQIPKAVQVIKRIPGLQSPRLMMIMAAMGGSVQKGRERLCFLSDQVNQWQTQKTQDLMPAGLWRIFALLSGTDRTTVTEGCTGWQLGLAAHMWYRTSSGDGYSEIETALAAYEETLNSLPKDEASICRPRATRRTESGKPLPCDDLRYGLIREFCLGPDALEDIVVGVDTPTYSTEKMDCWLAWSVVLFLSYVRDSSEELQRHLAKLTLELVGEFELHGEWESALHVAHFLADDSLRQRTVMTILASCDDPEKACELVPSRWVWEAVGLRSAYERDFIQAAQAWLRCGHYAKCIDTIRDHLLLPIVLSAGYEQERDFIAGPVTGSSLALIRWIYGLVKQMYDDRHRDARLDDLKEFLEALMASTGSDPIKIEPDFLTRVISESARENL